MNMEMKKLSPPETQLSSSSQKTKTKSNSPADCRFPTRASIQAYLEGEGIFKKKDEARTWTPQIFSILQRTCIDPLGSPLKPQIGVAKGYRLFKETSRACERARWLVRQCLDAQSIMLEIDEDRETFEQLVTLLERLSRS